MAESFGVQFGSPTTTGCPVVVCSLSSTAITIVLSDGTSSGAITMVATDSDGPSAPTPAGYVANYTFSGLSAFTQYTWTATQGANTLTGSFMTAPRAEDDFTLYLNTCMIGGQGVPTSYAGYMYHMKQQIQSGSNPPCVAQVFIDDYGYVDSDYLPQQTGKPSTTLKQYDYAVAYLNLFGLYDTDVSYTTNQNYNISMGQDPTRLWVQRNVNLIPQWGDHEFQDNLGWDGTPTTNDPTPNAYHATYDGIGVGQKDGAGLLTYNKFMLPLQGDDSIQSADTDSNHFQCDFGSVNIIAFDGVTQGSGDGSSTTAPTTVFGTNQIEDCLTALNTDHAFKILLFNNTIKDTGDLSTLTDIHPFSNNSGEYSRLFTDNSSSPSSIMDNDKTNGVLGITTIFVGDTHSQWAGWHQGAGDVSNHAEGFHATQIGTVNGSTNRPAKATEGTVSSTDIVVEYASDWGSFLDTDPSDNFGGVRVIFYGARYPKEMHVKVESANDGSDPSGAAAVNDTRRPDSWERKYAQYTTDNRGVSTSGSVSVATPAVTSDVDFFN